MMVIIRSSGMWHQTRNGDGMRAQAGLSEAATYVQVETTSIYANTPSMIDSIRFDSIRFSISFGWVLPSCSHDFGGRYLPTTTIQM